MQSRQKILPLTSMRFFAALYVVIFHTFPEITSARHPGRFVQTGFVSVSFFFVLSGYILTVAYLKDEQPLRVVGFWLARLARIYPLFLATLLLATPLFTATWVHRLGMRGALYMTCKVLLGNCLMLQVWDVHLRGIDNPNWSIAVEMFFYLIFPALAILFRSRTSRSLAIIAITSYAVGLLLVLGTMRARLPEVNIKLMPILHLHEFVEGVCVGMIVARLQGKTRQTLERISSVLLVSSAVVFAAVVFFSQNVPYLLLHDGLLSPLFLTVIVALAIGEGPMHRALSLQWLVLLGEGSFALYLIHVPLWSLARHLPRGRSISLYPFIIGGIVILSVLSYCTLEDPLRRCILEVFHGKPEETSRISARPQ
jgi:peptidoglycan/LPS O-acetylase OafA/YrhL